MDIRLLDIFFIGPVKILSSLYDTDINQMARVIMFCSGVGTIVYNGSTYLQRPDLVPFANIFFAPGRKDTKSDFMRYVDVFLLAPFLLWYARHESLPPQIQNLLNIIGVGTFVYNGANLLKQ